jgi:hypothetical protein
LRAVAIGIAVGVVQAVVAGTAAHAQPAGRPDSDRVRSENAALFFADALMPEIARACDARLPGYRAAFEPALAAWRRANAATLADGERTLREMLPRLGETLESARAKALADVRRLATAPAEDAERTCRAAAWRIGAERP